MNIRTSSWHGPLTSSISLAAITLSLATAFLDDSLAQDGAAISSGIAQGSLTERDLSVLAPPSTNEPANQANPSPTAPVVSTSNDALGGAAPSGSSPSFSGFEVTGGLGQQAPSSSVISDYAGSASAAASLAVGSAPNAEVGTASAATSSSPPAMAVTYAAHPALLGSSSAAEINAAQPSSMIAAAQSSSAVSSLAVSSPAVSSPAVSSPAVSSPVVSSPPVSPSPLVSSSVASSAAPFSTVVPSGLAPEVEPPVAANASSASLPALLPAPTPSSAEAILRTPGVSLVDYPVRGTNHAELTKDLDLFSTGGAGGSKSDFGFTWVLSWSYTTDSITSQPVVKVSPRFNIELPRWTNFEAATARDRELWANYRANLLRGIEARILLVQAFVPRAEAEIQAFVTQNPKAKQIEIDDVLNSTIRVLQMRLRTLQSTEASDFPRKPLLGIGAP